MSRITKEWRVALRYMLFFPAEIARLTYVFRHGHYDLVHVSGGSWQIKGVVAAKLAGVKVVWHLNDTLMPWAIRRLFAVISQFADGYIFASQRSREYYGSLVNSRKPAFIVPAPVDTKALDPACDYTGDEGLIGQWADRIVVGMVANINPIKGVETLIRVAAAVGERKSDLQLVVVGPVYKNQQSYFERLEHLSRNLGVGNLTFVGGRSDVRPLLKRFDIYLCTSLAESSPMAVWEAMSMETPIVSTDVGDVPLYVKEGESGFVAPVGDWEALAGHVLALAEDEDMRKRLGVEARRVAVRELDIEMCAQRHYEAYTFLVNGAGNAANTDNREEDQK